jgi:HK97 family phage prohead protease
MKQPKQIQCEVRTLQTNELRVTKATDGSRTLNGLVPYNSLSADLGGWNEIIAPGAFAGAFNSKADVLCLRDHDAKQLLGRTKSKTLSLTDSPEGLRFACKLPNTTQATDLAESVDRGDLDANSFGFITKEDKWTADASGIVLRTLIAVDLVEVSPCSFPAYPSSQVDVRTMPIEIRSMIEKRSEPEVAQTNAAGCACLCSQCVADACGICSADDCLDDECACQEQRAWKANTEIRLKLALAD